MESAIYSATALRYNIRAVLELTWTLAETVVKIRKHKRWSRRRLAKEAQLSYATITRFETGREVKESTVRGVASAFRLSPADLYALVPPTLDALALERNRIWLSLDGESRVKLLEVMRQYEPAPYEANPSQDQRPPLATEGKAVRSGREKR